MQGHQILAASQLGGLVDPFAKQANASPPPTLTGAIGSSAALNKRLEEIMGRVVQIAQAIGGPFPISASPPIDGSSASSVVHRLNDNIDSAHRKLTEIDAALSALQRTLGE